MIAALYLETWQAKPDRYRVACYGGDFSATPVTYTRAVAFDHRTLKAACRRLASLIARQSRRGYTGVRYDSLYVLTPDGRRLPLIEARKESGDVR